MKLNTIESLDIKTESIQSLVDLVNSSHISSIRSSVNAIIRVINDPNSTVRELKEVILLDPPLAARVLKTANSAYYSRSFTRVFADIEQAIIWMGSEIIRELALSQKVCEVFNKDEKIEAYSRKSLWRHSIAVALMAKMIYRKEFGLKGENVYVSGLLHDIGIIAEDQFLSKDFRNALILSTNKKIDITRAEFQTLGYNHAEVGEAIIDSWGLPPQSIGMQDRILQDSRHSLYCRLYLPGKRFFLRRSPGMRQKDIPGMHRRNRCKTLCSRTHLQGIEIGNGKDGR